MINNNQNKNQIQLLTFEKINKQKKQEIDQSAIKIQPSLDLFLRNYNDEMTPITT